MDKLLIALVGVIVGFILGEVKELVSAKRRKKTLRNALWDEVCTIKSQARQKQDILHQMQNSLKKGQVLPGNSVHFARTLYTNFQPELLILSCFSWNWTTGKLV